MAKIQLGPKPFLLPQPAVLVGTVVDGLPNFMLAAWCGVANQTPPMVTVAVRPNRHTQRGIEANRAFSLNIPSANLAVKADYCGIVSGKNADKSSVFTLRKGTVAGAPLIEECPLILECRLVQTLELPTHHLHLGEVVEVHADADCLVEGVPEMGKVDPLVYSITDGQYWKIGEPVAKAFQVGKQLEP
ncbi:MAG TPA: flavin reductase family protein [Deferrisomatales bacterium]|nr:flavin reductase family protein [Deferrisomatales bacterium]